MSNTLDEHTSCLIKSLIEQISGIDVTTGSYTEIEKRVLRNVRMADSLYFSNKPEIDRIIESLANKYTLHGYTSQAKRVKHYYEKLIPANLTRYELATRLNIVKFLLGVSQSPTNNFHKYGGSVKSFEKGDAKDDIVDWPSYLQEGIARWSPVPDDDSDDWTDSSDDTNVDSSVVDYANSSPTMAVGEVHSEDQDILLLYRSSKTSLTKNVQSGWFNTDKVICTPLSEDREANIALSWENFVHEKTWGLLPQPTVSVLTEYKVMREILWQFYKPTTSSCFNLVGNKIAPSMNVTISSVRSPALQVMLFDVVPYINWLEVFRDFHNSLSSARNEFSVIRPNTYRNYSFGVQSILSPLFNSLKLIEDNVKAQERTNTLLTTANEFRLLFHTVKVLYNIHCKVILDFKEHSSFECATTLLWRLRNSLLYTSSKLEHDLYLTLYLHSLSTYLSIINSWLSRGKFEDQTGEFIISGENLQDSNVLFNRSDQQVNRGEQEWHMEFVVKQTTLTPSDSIFDIICTHVMQIRKNIHLLRLLGKLHLVPEFTGKSNETLDKAFVRRVLERIKDFFQPEEKIEDVLTVEDQPTVEDEPISGSSIYIFPAIRPDGCKYFTEMDKLENLVDTSDVFLMKAFESFFIKKPEYKSDIPEKTLFQKITEVTTGFFPAYEILEDVFVTILKERYEISGIMVKNVLINDYNLEKQFSFLMHVYLFEDDVIFPIYLHIFDLIDSGYIWTNRAQLSSHSQDIIMDLYPDFYDKCIIDIQDSCKLTKNPFKCCQGVNINYKIPWPVNIILRHEHMLMYKELFQFILSIKWALYTLNHMYFREIEHRTHMVNKPSKTILDLTKKLKLLRFGLVNVFSSIQHYVLGHIYTKHLLTFKKAFEEAYDLESLIVTHSTFIRSLHKECVTLRDYTNSNNGIFLLFYVVTRLRCMWRDVPGIDQVELNHCADWYLRSREVIDPILNPTSYYNFVSKH